MSRYQWKHSTNFSSYSAFEYKLFKNTLYIHVFAIHLPFCIFCIYSYLFFVFIISLIISVHRTMTMLTLSPYFLIYIIVCCYIIISSLLYYHIIYGYVICHLWLCDYYMAWFSFMWHLGKGSKKNKKKLVEFSTKRLTPLPLVEKKI